MFAMSFSESSPLLRLIGRHEGDRSYLELHEASGGVISVSEWEELEFGSRWERRPIDPLTVGAIGLALGLRGSTVRHFEVASLGLPPGWSRTLAQEALWVAADSEATGAAAAS